MKYLLEMNFSKDRKIIECVVVFILICNFIIGLFFEPWCCFTTSILGFTQSSQRKAQSAQSVNM